MDHNRRIFSGLNDFVEIAEPPTLTVRAALASGPSTQRVFTAFHQIPSDKIGCGKVVVARNGD